MQKKFPKKAQMDTKRYNNLDLVLKFWTNTNKKNLYTLNTC